MPIGKVKGGYKWGKHGKTYKSRKGAERQAAAAHANGYKGMYKSLIGRIQILTKASNEELGITNPHTEFNKKVEGTLHRGKEMLRKRGYSDEDINAFFAGNKEIPDFDSREEGSEIKRLREYNPEIDTDGDIENIGGKVFNADIDPDMTIPEVPLKGRLSPNIQNMKKSLPDRIAQFVNAQEKKKRVDNRPRLPYNDGPMSNM